MPEARPTVPQAPPSAAGQKGPAKTRRKLTLFWRVNGLVWSLLLFAILIPTLLTIRSSDRILRQKLMDHGTTIAATVANSTANLIASEDTHSLQGLLLNLVQGDGRMAAARICNKSGTVICQTREEEKDSMILELATPLAQTIAKEVARPDGTSLLEVSTPLFKYGEPWGTFQFELSLAHLAGEVAATVERSLWMGLVLLVAGTLASAWLARAISRPIQKLALVAAEVAGGNLAARSGLTSSDELGDLARAFDNMAAELSRATSGLRTRSSSLERQVTRRTQALEVRSTELAEAKKAVEVASRSKGDFLASLSQEMRSPVDQIIGMADIALDTHLLPEQRQYITLAKESALGLRVMLKDIVEFFSKLECGRADAVAIGFELRDLVGDMLHLVAARAHEKGLELVGQVKAGVPDALVGDPDRVRQVLLNLLAHMIRFTQRGEVVLRVERDSASEEEATLHFTLADMGPAVPREQQDAIREALSSARDPGARNLQDADLGLTISAQLAQTMGGEITFEGLEGKGNAFHFKAAFRVEPDATTLARSRPSVPRGLSAVVVAAGPALRCALAETIEAWKMKAVPADGARAAAILEEAAKAGRRPDLVVLDAAIPPAERLALLEAAESRPGLIPALILLHGAAEAEEEAGKWSHLTRVALVRKPVKESDLIEAILQVALQHCSC